ncbi:MAG: excinuclease ABC subunit UvrA [Cytophagales bacterium]|nr:excinuclease ABC subunit UvrA [Cytophagales bacterium]
MTKTKTTTALRDPTGHETIEVIGAREHNLKDITLSLPRNKLVVVTGISGSGKSSLAFDTIYAEGQRRYMESFSAYARSFIGNLERPDVDKINGLSPVISIEQKTTSRNPRSTVGTVTEIYDFMRLLFARAGEAYSYLSGRKMVKQNEEQILQGIFQHFKGKKLTLLSPLVRGRKGHYRELFVQIRKSGFARVRVDGEVMELVAKMQLDRYKIHDIEVVIDRIVADEKDHFRISQSVARALKEGKGVMMLLEEDATIHHFSKHLMDPTTGLSYDDPAPNLFSFNSPYGACSTCNGLGVIEEITEDSVIPNKKISIARGGILPLGTYRDIWIFKKVEAILKRYKLSLTTPLTGIPKEVISILLYGDDVPVAVPSVKYPGTAWNTKFEGIISFLEKMREESSEGARKWIADFTITRVCPDCEGKRLKKEPLHFRLDGKNIAELAQLDIQELMRWFTKLEDRLSEKQNRIASEILKEIRKRIGFLLDVGLEYLDLNRPLRTLSGGEAQRIRLATQIGTQLVGVLYILDEPSIGLHARDNIKLINALKNLRDIGNTVIVVEHDKEMMLASDYIIDIGPGAGRHGGRVVAAGAPPDFLENDSVTSRYLKGSLSIPYVKDKRQPGEKALVLTGASGNNLQNITLQIPLGLFVCVTGVSGSGKSTLIHETLFPILSKHLYHSRTEPLPYKKVTGLDEIDKVIEVDQSPIGRTPRSNPATYTGVFTDIRDLFSQMPEAKIRGYKPGRFSFNVKGGRCETCQGGGLRLIEMEFLPDVYVRCETCKGKRYNRETLEVRFKGKSISDVLDMTVEEAVVFFENQPRVLRKIETLNDVGLGYISLGQHATTLSGGEAQRVKLATELSKRDTGKTLYILDEPTTGLHFQDIAHLLDVLQKLVDKGNTVLVIEHNMDVVKSADRVIDMGPEGGAKGGSIVAVGTPAEIARKKASYTGRFLKSELPSGRKR